MEKFICLKFQLELIFNKKYLYSETPAPAQPLLPEKNV